jgi:hypothetical protein
MTSQVHPSSGELLAALDEPDLATRTLEHIEECLACRVRLARLRSTPDLEPASEDLFQRLVQASTPLPVAVADLVASSSDRTPRPNEIWRVGRSEALLVWVRRVFDDGVADVVPLVLDVELADQQSILVPADTTPLGTQTAAIVALRTHVHPDAFLNHVGDLDISREVAEVLTSVQEGRRPSGVSVGPPISDDRDQRLEYRQALRDLLAELTPSAWPQAADEVEAQTRQTPQKSTSPPGDEDLKSIKARLTERLSGIRFIDGTTRTIAVDDQVTAMRTLKIAYLDTAILVITIDIEIDQANPDYESLATACLHLAQSEPDVDTVLVSVPHDDWPTLLFPLANLRPAYQAPSGVWGGPTPILDSYGLVDTLCKHLEGMVSAWEVTEAASSRIGRTNLHEVTTRHAGASIDRIRLEGSRAKQPAKKAAWGNLNDSLGQRLARFVLAIVNNDDVGGALTELLQVSESD